MTNTFTAAKSKITIEEKTDDGIKSEIYVKNEGTATSYVRVKLVMNWVSKDGKTISATPVNISVDYDKTNWFEQGGIYYYKTPVAPVSAKPSKCHEQPAEDPHRAAGRCTRWLSPRGDGAGREHSGRAEQSRDR